MRLDNFAREGSLRKSYQLFYFVQDFSPEYMETMMAGANNSMFNCDVTKTELMMTSNYQQNEWIKCWDLVELPILRLVSITQK